MEKAYDLKDLLERCKGDGLELAEEELKNVIGHVANWLEESAVLSPNKIDDLVALGVPQLEKLALGLADKVNPAD